MDYERHRREMLQHCIRLARIDKRYAWWAAQRYATESQGVLANLPHQLTAAMLALAADQTRITKEPNDHRNPGKAVSR